MQPLDLKKLTPWNLGAVHPIFLGEMHVNPRTLKNITFREICSMHKSPTIGVTEDEMKEMATQNNKYLNVSSYSTSNKPLRPDLSDIEIALIHATVGNMPDAVISETLNISIRRLRHIRKATEHLYKQANVKLPSLPLVTITDTSRYWTDEELLETYDISKEDLSLDYGTHYKDLLRRLEIQSKNINFPINDSLCSEEDNGNSVPKGNTLPNEVLEQDKEDYSELCSILWAHVSREDGLSKRLLFKDWGTNEPLVVPIEYTSAVTTKNGKQRALDHHHKLGGYSKPLNIPKNIVKLAVDIHNAYLLKTKETPPTLEHLVINLLSSLEYTSKELGVNIKPLSSSRGHCSPSKNKYIYNTPPLIYPKFTSKHYGYGIICHHCSTFLSEKTVNRCEHATISTYLVQETGRFAHVIYNKPSIYLYTPLDTLDYSLYYYDLDDYGSISTVFTLNLLQFYTNFSIPVHKVPFEV